MPTNYDAWKTATPPEPDVLECPTPDCAGSDGLIPDALVWTDVSVTDYEVGEDDDGKPIILQQVKMKARCPLCGADLWDEAVV